MLVVEDDAAVRRLARRILETAGYTVLAASRAAPALRAVERWGERIDALVTDIVMPGMNGLDLAARIAEQSPGIGVVFISGNPDGVLDRDKELRSAGAFVAKPFTAEVLRRAVDSAVGRSNIASRGARGRAGSRIVSGIDGATVSSARALRVVSVAGAESGPE